MTDADVDREPVARFVDPLEQRMMAAIAAPGALSGRAGFCLDHPKAFRTVMKEGQAN